MVGLNLESDCEDISLRRIERLEIRLSGQRPLRLAQT